MTFSYKGYEGVARKLAARCAFKIDELLNTPRRIRTETSNFVLGAEAMPAPIAMRGAQGGRR
jgi:hypothetical protein